MLENNAADLQEGEKLIAQFIGEVAGLPVESMDDKQLLDRVASLRYTTISLA